MILIARYSARPKTTAGQPSERARCSGGPVSGFVWPVRGGVDDGEHRGSHLELVPQGSLADCRQEPVAVLSGELIGGDEIVSEAAHREAPSGCWCFVGFPGGPGLHGLGARDGSKPTSRTTSWSLRPMLDGRPRSVRIALRTRLPRTSSPTSIANVASRYRSARYDLAVEPLEPFRQRQQQD